MAIPVNTYTKHSWVDDSSPDLEAEILNEIETGIKDNNDAIKAITAAVVNQIINDPDKIASMAALYAVNQTLSTLSTTVTNINSNLSDVNSSLTVSAQDTTGFTLASGVVGTVVIQKMGRVRIVNIDLNPSSYTASAANQLLTLSDRPISFINSSGYKGSSLICGTPVRFQMATNGVVFYYCDTASVVGAIRAQFTYLTQ